MRTALTVAAFAAGALAIPYKRDVVTDVNVVYVTDVVTVTAGQQAPAYSSAPAPVSKAEHYGHHNWGTTTVVQVTSTSAPATYVAPSSSAAPTYEAPTTSSTVPAYTAPASSSSAPVYQAPVSSSAPASSYSAPASSSAASSAAPTSYQEIAVYHHNLHRANHTCEDIEWDDGLAASAQIIAESCVYAHNTDVNGGGYGQNIAAGVEPANISAIITDLFYNGEEPYYSSNYGLADPDMSLFEKWGHFSQIVWKSTTHVGCYTQHCPSGLGNVGSDVSPYFTVCNYKTPGNYGGEYADNVLAPLGHATANWNTGLSQ